MSEHEIAAIAEKAEFVVNGYAFSKREDGFIGILNLAHPDCSMIVDNRGGIIETNMDPIEQEILRGLCSKNLQFMEDEDA